MDKRKNDDFYFDDEDSGFGDFFEYEDDPIADEEDRLWGALCWLQIVGFWPLLSILLLVLPQTRARAFVRYNALLTLVTGLALIPVSILTCGLGALLYFMFFYWAYVAFQGRWVEVPWVSGFVRQWV